MQTKEKLLWTLFGVVAIGVGLYPLTYTFLNSKTTGLLASKKKKLVADIAYMTAFYIHITFGGMALLTGWSQFIKSWRNKHLKFHRSLGYVYVISVFISSISGFIIALFSSGKIVAIIGFAALAVLWFTSNLLALIKIKKGMIREHQMWMIRNYALTFSAVTLRIYLPIVLAGGGSIVLALQIASWLCWVPNLLSAEIYIHRRCGGVISPTSK